MKIQNPLIIIIVINLILLGLSCTFYQYLKFYFVISNKSTFFLFKERNFNIVFWILDILSHSIFLIFFISTLNLDASYLPTIQNFILFPMLIWEVSSIAFVLFLIIGYFIHFLIQLIEKIFELINYSIQNLRFNHKYNYFKKTFIVLLILSISILIYESNNAENIKISYIELAKDDFSKKISNLTITHISDIHFGYYMDPKKFEKISEKINQIESDILVISGDLIIRWEKDFDYVHKGLEKIKKHPYGNYMVLGNHEHYFPVDKSIDLLKKIENFKLLVNENFTIQHNQQNIHIIGVDFSFSKSKQNQEKFLKKALENINYANKNDFKILLAHDPNFFDLALENEIDLVLSGHTHGGQIRIPYLEYADLIFKYSLGIYKHKNDNFTSYLNINSGLGNSFIFPIRVNCPREISVLNIN